MYRDIMEREDDGKNSWTSCTRYRYEAEERCDCTQLKGRYNNGIEQQIAFPRGEEDLPPVRMVHRQIFALRADGRRRGRRGDGELVELDATEREVELEFEDLVDCSS
jgi:hypothetical protein